VEDEAYAILGRRRRRRRENERKRATGREGEKGRRRANTRRG